MVDFLIFAAVLSFLIIAHEAGHLVASRIAKIKVDEFGLGYPPRVATLFTAGGTKFTLNLIPFGGFVRIAGEDDPDVPNGLASSKKRTRAMVLVAGPAANVLIALLAFTFAFKFAAPDPERVFIASVVPGSPAEFAGIQSGDIVLNIEDTPITGISSMQQVVRSNLGSEVTIVLEREGETLALSLVPRPNPPPNDGPIGVVIGNPTREVGWPEAAGLAFRSTTLQVNAILRLPARVFSGDVQPEQARVTGLKGIYDMLAWAGEIDRMSHRPFVTLNLVGVISIGLAIANLLPFPALDGGRLAFVAVEAILRRRVTPRYEGLAHAIGFAILIVVLIYVNLQDFINPITLPR